MPRELKISVGQYSDKGRKETNQDFHGVLIPDEPLLSLKGIAIVLADGIVEQQCQPGRGRVRGQGIPDRLLLHLGILVGADLGAAGAGGDQFLAARADPQSQYSYDRDRGYVCTLSAIVIKSTTAHLFHIGDCRIYRLSGNTLEQLTNDHRVIISSEQSYLGRALGVNPQIEIDYQMLRVEQGDIFVLATDGIYEHVGAASQSQRRSGQGAPISTRPRTPIVELAFEPAARTISPSRSSASMNCPKASASEVFGQPNQLPPPPLLEARAVFDGYRIVRELHGSSRSHIYLARRYRDRRRRHHQDSVDRPARRPRISEAVHDGGVGGAADRQPACAETLPAVAQAQFPLCRDRIYRRPDADAMDDRQSETDAGNGARHRRADRQRPAGVSPQGDAASGRQARQHHDRRTGTVKIIDFGSTRITGVVEAAPSGNRDDILGTAQYTAPEYFLGERGHLALRPVLARRHHLSDADGQAALWRAVAKARTRSQFSKLLYSPASHGDREIPHMGRRHAGEGAASESLQAL